MRNPATLKKISDHLSVSISTVSRALKDHQDVSAETKRRVKELAAMLDYEPNSFAINLRRKHSDLFAVIVPEISSYFFSSFIQAVEEESRKLGYSIMILQSQDDPEQEANNLKLCRYNQVAGVFIAINSNEENSLAYQKMEEWDIPLIFFDKVPSEGIYNKVCIADEAVGSLAAEKMVTSGRSKIFAILGCPSISITRRREIGIRQYLQTHAPQITLEVAYALDEAGAEVQLGRYFSEDQPGTVIFCMSDQVLCGALHFLNARNLRFPTDVSLLAVSNGFLPRLFNPQISYVETNGGKLGKATFGKMKELMENRKLVNESFMDCPYFEGGSL